jgi:hypothetical protein
VISLTLDEVDATQVPSGSAEASLRPELSTTSPDERLVALAIVSSATGER